MRTQHLHAVLLTRRRRLAAGSIVLCGILAALGLQASGAASASELFTLSMSSDNPDVKAYLVRNETYGNSMCSNGTASLGTGNTYTVTGMNSADCEPGTGMAGYYVEIPTDSSVEQCQVRFYTNGDNPTVTC
jgi:hypothetical protein